MQTAALAEAAGASDALITAALLHDLGHLLNLQGETPTAHGIDDQHQYVALPFLRATFPDAVLEPIFSREVGDAADEVESVDVRELEHVRHTIARESREELSLMTRRPLAVHAWYGVPVSKQSRYWCCSGDGSSGEFFVKISSARF